MLRRAGVSALARFDGWLRRLIGATPLTNAYGLARALIAAAGLTTLLANPLHVLFPGPTDGSAVVECTGAAELAVYCVVPDLAWARVVAVVVLLVVVSGYFPRWTVLPHWWVALSLHLASPVVDGGDQVAAIVTLLLVPVGLADPRRNHWGPPADDLSEFGEVQPGPVVARLALGAIRVQAAVIYLVAGFAKFLEPEWQDGTALYYWLGHPVFGPPEAVQVLLAPVLREPMGVAALTWGSAVLEILLAMALLLGVPHRRPLLWLGIAFHVAIALLMGLISFSVTMVALLVLYLHPVTVPIRWPDRLARVVSARWRRVAGRGRGVVVG